MAMFLARIELSGVSLSHGLYLALQGHMERSGFARTVEDDTSGRRVQLPHGTFALERDGLAAAEAHALAAAAVEEALVGDEDGASVSPSVLVCEARRFVWTGLPSSRPALRLVGASTGSSRNQGGGERAR
jgi:Endoribonuclease GhoS